MVPLAFILPSLFVFSLSLAQDPIHIPLTRRSRAPNAFNPTEEAYKLRFKYHFADETTPVHRDRLGRRAFSPEVPIINQDMDTGYLGTISVGTPPQMFNVYLDTGSSDLWLANTSCLGCLPSTPHYLPSKSNSFQGAGQQGNTSLGQNVTIIYGTGMVVGVAVADTVTMGGLEISSQIFVSADQVSNGFLNGSASGLMGLAFDALAQTNATPFWEALVNNNQLSSPEMSFWLARSTNAQAIEVPGGVLTLGGTNSSLFTGDIEFLNMSVAISPPAYWLLEISAVSVGGQSVKIGTGRDALAVIDTGTTLIGGPTADVRAIWDTVSGAAPSREIQGFFEFPCTGVVNISFSFGGKHWPISSQDMNLGAISPKGSRCVGAIFDLTTALNITNGPPWVVGDTFLKNVYSVFRANPASIGFAQLSNFAVAGVNSTVGTTSTAGSNPSATTGSSKKNGSGSMHLSTIFTLIVSGLLMSIFMLVL